jgi:hypothetical protein
VLVPKGGDERGLWYEYGLPCITQDVIKFIMHRKTHFDFVTSGHQIHELHPYSFVDAQQVSLNKNAAVTTDDISIIQLSKYFPEASV